ncbi:MAG: hypothetical protein H7061_06585 [Bdellovibrionaceae bacterium]|nr:hypothetical protein [Bdellovibrio sp.]
MNKGFLLVVIALLTSGKVMAVPLFGETAGTIREGILTLFKDSHDPNKVYFFPNSTQFSRDNSKVPLFNFVYWGLDEGTNKAEAGAYMTLSTHLASDPSQQAALDNYIKNHPQMEVAVLPIKSSKIGLQTTIPNEQPLKILFTEFNFAKTGGRAEDEIGVNAVLTPIGARAFKALLSKDMGGGKLKFDYCYTIQGLGPNMDASVSVDMRRVYEYFEGSHTGGWGWFAWSIKTVVEHLNEQHAINITMNGGDAKQWEVLNTVAATITERLFKPELSASPVSPASTNNVFNFGVGYVKKEELKNETWNFVRRDLEEREFCTAVVVKDLQGHLDQLVTRAD